MTSAGPPAAGWQPELSRAGSGPPVLLLNPLGADRRCWGELAARVPDLELISCDFPGQGRTPSSDRRLTIADLALGVAAELDRLPAAANAGVGVVGVSLGGLVAQQLAASRPDLVRALVLVDTVARYPEALREHWTHRAEIARTRGLEQLLEPTRITWFSPSFLAAEPPIADLLAAMLAATDPAGYALLCEALRDADTTAVAAQITARTLVLCGREDGPAFLTAARWLADSIPGARLSWLDGRHGAAFEEPDAFAALIRQFLG